MFVKFDARQQLENLGLPLTIEPHDAHKDSVLSTNDMDLRGMVNLLVLLLLTYHLRAMIESFLAHNFVLKDKVMEFLQSGIITDPRNYYTLLAGLTLIQFPAFGFVVEKLAAMGYLNNFMVVIIEVAYLTCLLIYPIVLIQWIESDVLPATYFMLFATTLALKLTSFHHVCLDNRYLLKRV